MEKIQKIESIKVGLYSDNLKRKNFTVQQLIAEKKDINITGFILLGYLQKLDRKILKLFFILSSITKMVNEN